MSMPDEVVIDGETASLWRYDEFKGCYKIVFPSEEPRLFEILRKKAFVREGDGKEAGQYLYMSKQQ